MTSTIGFTKANYKIYESGTSTDIPTLERIGDSTAIASVKVSLKSGTAIVGKDVNSFSQTISWAAGDSSPKQINLAPIADSLEEYGEYVTLSLSTVRGASYGLVKTAQVEIADTKTVVSQLNDTDLIKISRNDSSSLIAFSDFKESVGTLGGGGGGVSPLTTQRISITLYIDTANGNDSNNGSSTSQFKTWARAKQELMKGIISYAQILVNGTLEAPIDIDGLMGMSNNPRNKSTLQIAPQWGSDIYEYTIVQTNPSDYRLLTPNRNVSVELWGAILTPSSKFNLDQLNLYLNNAIVDCSSCNWDVLRFTNGYYDINQFVMTGGSYKELLFGPGSYGTVRGSHFFDPEWEGRAFEFENGSNIYFQAWTQSGKQLYAHEAANATLSISGDGYSIESGSYPIKTTDPLPDIMTIANAVSELQKNAIATAPVKEFPWVPSDLNGGILYYLGDFVAGFVNPHTAGIIEITADSYYVEHEPYRLLDNESFTNWDAVGIGYHWLQIDFKNRPAIVNRFVFLKTSYMNNISDFVLNTVCKVSNDGQNWTELLTLTQSNANYADSGPINNTTAYRYIRWEQVADVNYWNMGGLQLFGFY